MFRLIGWRSQSLYYGWVVVAAVFAMFTIVWALPAAYAIFFKPLQDTFGWSRTTVSWGATIQLISYALFMAPAGWAMDRMSTRLLYLIAGVVIGGSVVLTSLVNQPWQLYLAWGFTLGIGQAICGPTTVSLVTRWFTKKRGLALGLASAGVGSGGLIGAPLANYLITAYDWRRAMVILGVAAGAVVLAGGFFMRRAPSLDSRPASGVRLPKSKSISVKQAVFSQAMLLLLVAQVPEMFAIRVIQVHFARHVIDFGVATALAALLIATIGAFGIGGRVVLGFAQDRVGARPVRIACLGAQGVAMLALPFIGSMPGFFIFAAIFGLTWGGDVPQVASLSAQFFGMAAMGVAYGVLVSAGNLLGAWGPSLAGFVYDSIGTYTPVFLGAGAALLAVAVPCVWKLRAPKEPGA